MNSYNSEPGHLWLLNSQDILKAVTEIIEPKFKGFGFCFLFYHMSDFERNHFTFFYYHLQRQYPRLNRFLSKIFKVYQFS